MVRLSIAGIVGGLSAVSLVGLSWLGFGLGWVPAREAAPEATRAPAAAAAAVLEADSAVRAAVEVARTSEVPSAQPGAAEAKTEAQYRARSLAVAARQPGSLEELAPRVLAGSGPDCEKVALLRALCDCGSARAAEILATAVTDLPDVSGPQGESVPRCALRFLSDRAEKDARARAALLRLAWSAEKQVSASLRTAAAASVALVASGTEARQIARWLEIEKDPLVHAAALEALSRNPDPDAVAALTSTRASSASDRRPGP